MIFRSDRTIFFHPGKAAGTAIESAFGFTDQTHPPGEVNFDVLKGWDREGEVYLQHATPSYMKPRVDPAEWRDYFKFTVVRNPYDRLVSVYDFQHRAHRRRFGDFDNFVRSLPKFLREPYQHNGRHYIPQYEHAHIEGERVVDMVLKFEGIEADFLKLCNRVGRHMKLAPTNTATDPLRPQCPAAEVYSDVAVATVQEVYRRDFECFGYDLEPPATLP